MIQLRIALAFVLMSCWASSYASEFRIIEAEPLIARYLVKQYPDQVKLFDEGDLGAKLNFQQFPHLTLMVPQDMLPTISMASHELTGHCGGFIDVTEEKGLASHEIAKRPKLETEEYELPFIAEAKSEIVTGIKQLNAKNIEAMVKVYSTKFRTRLASSEQGVQAAEWLKSQWQLMANKAGRDDVLVESILPPSGYDQKSVRITIVGSEKSLPIVVLGAHLDSINGSGTAPGADDDASGIATITEVYRVLLNQKFKPKATVQIFGYAGEELGLLGSRVIAQSYSSKGIPVRGAMQIDMDAYVGSNRKMTFMLDYVSKDLTIWSEQLYGIYVGSAFQEDRCGYGCSDHASWNRYGYPAVMPFETKMNDMNENIHSARDTWENGLDAEYALQFAKLAYAFVSELSETY